MPKLENHLGSVGISDKYMYSLVEYTVSTCYGVAGLGCIGKKSFVRTAAEKVGAEKNKAVTIGVRGGKLVIGLHITVIYGVNISAVTDSLVHKLRYTVSEKTGVEIGRITVYIDGMTD